MPEIDVLYLYEYAARELDVACAVKAIAERHYGLSIHIEQHPYGDLASNLSRFRPRILVFPHMATPFVPYVLDWPEAIYVNLMWEQILYKGNLKAKLPRGEFALHHVLHCVWGDNTADLLQEIGVPAEHIVVNGNPIYFLYEEPYRRYYNRRAELARIYRLDPAKRWVFFPENYNWAFYDEVQVQSFIDGGQRAEEVRAMQRFCLLSFAEVMKWCRAAAQNAPVEIVIRPRPGTALDHFQSVVRQTLTDIPDRLHIIKDETVREWIIASDVVVSSYSTSLIEAAVAGKPAYILEPQPIPEFIHMNWHNLAPHVATQIEFEYLCLSAETSSSDGLLGEWARTTMMMQGDSIWGLAELFARLSRGQAPHPPAAPPRKMSLPPAFDLPPRLLFEYHSAFRKYQRLSRKLRNYRVHPNFTHERELVGQEEIARRTTRWAQILAESHAPLANGS